MALRDLMVLAVTLGLSACDTRQFAATQEQADQGDAGHEGDESSGDSFDTSSDDVGDDTDAGDGDGDGDGDDGSLPCEGSACDADVLLWSTAWLEVDVDAPSGEPGNGEADQRIRAVAFDESGALYLGGIVGSGGPSASARLVRVRPDYGVDWDFRDAAGSAREIAALTVGATAQANGRIYAALEPSQGGAMAWLGAWSRDGAAEIDKPVDWGRVRALTILGEHGYACGHTLEGPDAPTKAWVRGLDSNLAATWYASPPTGADIDEDDECRALAAHPTDSYLGASGVVMTAGVAERDGQTRAWWATLQPSTGAVASIAYADTAGGQAQAYAVAWRDPISAWLVGVRDTVLGYVGQVNAQDDAAMQLPTSEDRAWLVARASNDGGLVLAGERLGMARVIKLDASGQIVWSRGLGARRVYAIDIAPDGRVALAGSQGEPGGQIGWAVVFAP